MSLTCPVNTFDQQSASLHRLIDIVYVGVKHAFVVLVYMSITLRYSNCVIKDHRYTGANLGSKRPLSRYFPVQN